MAPDDFRPVALLSPGTISLTYHAQDVDTAARDRPTIEITHEMFEALQARGLVIVPIKATDEMLDAAKESAWAENAAGVWDDMIGSVLKHRENRDI